VAAGNEVQDGERRPGVAAEAVGSFIADGAGGGQHARKLAQGKSRRWRRPKEVQSKAITEGTKP